ncbi:MAG: S8 family serine peptidase [Gaiellaceae bacterium]
MRRIALVHAAAACAVLVAASAAGARPTLTAPAAKPKLAVRLAALSHTARTHGLARALAAARASGEDVAGGRVAVEVEATGVARAPAALAAVRRAGGRIVHANGRRATVLLPPGALESVAQAGAVRFVGDRARPFLDALPGEGVSSTGAPRWHAAGWTGTGVKLGVIDGGFAGYRARQATGDLPASVELVDFCQLSRFEALDHGTAVAEIVHEMAPGARISLICIDDGVALGEALLFARQNGIRIVNHSAAWFNSWRGDGTGPPETPDGVASAAQAADILWVNSAGNYARAHWSGRLDEAGFGWHEFAPGDVGNSFTLEPRAEACVFLKWDDWPVTAQDFDLFVYRDKGHVPIAASIEEQFGEQEPREQTCFSFDGTEPEAFSVQVQRQSGFGTPRLDVVVPGRRLEYQTAAGSLGEPASSPAALAVGAVCWQTNALEPYSSQGPTIDGRRKPELAGPDSVSSATFGLFAGCGEHIGFPGTSASAPHVAGAAALVRQARPWWTAAQIRAFLVQRTADVGVAGRDNQSGAGRLALGPPLGRVANPPAPLRLPQPLSAPAIRGAISHGSTVHARPGRWRGTAPISFRYTWLRCSVDGVRCSKSGRFGARYAVRTEDGDFTLRLAVTATNAAGTRTVLSRASDPVPGGYSSEPGDELVLYSFTTTATPRPGGVLEANVRVIKIDGTILLGAAVRCTATAAGRRLVVVARGFSNGLARCRWRVPASAAEARVNGMLTVVAGGREARRAFATTVTR